MLGYVQPLKAEMKVKEYDVYKAIYCGLCKTLGKLFGFAARMTLSYDFAFLAILHLSINGASASFKQSACIAHPVTKRPMALQNNAIDYAAMTAAITIYHKVKDNIADRHFPGNMPPAALLPFAKSAYKKAARRYPALAEEIGAAIERQTALEREGCTSLDRAAEPTALMMAAIARGVTEDTKQQIALERFGYQLGRWIYFTDALDDMEKDAREGAYNPFLLQKGEREDIRARARDSINLTAGELALSYSLLRLSGYQPILDNVIYLGMPGTLEKILNGQTKEKEDE